MGKSVGYECVDVATDMESCGGCQFPIMGEARGEDCTAKEGVDNVSVSSGPSISEHVAYPFVVVRCWSMPGVILHARLQVERDRVHPVGRQDFLEGDVKRWTIADDS
jgi:hypothetical protein